MSKDLEEKIKVLLDGCHSEGRFAFPINLATAVAEIAKLIREEHKRLRAILGFDVETEEEWNGETCIVCHDPYYDLEGAVIDLERQEADKVCIGTIKRHQVKLIAFDKATKAEE